MFRHHVQLGNISQRLTDREEDGQWEGDDLNDQADDDNDDDLDVLDTKEDGHREGDYNEQDARVGEQICEQSRTLVTH